MKNFFKNLLAIALVGVMVGNVACNKYDDDINGLTERLDKIEGTMALKTDVQALQSTVNALNGIDFNAFMKSADFASMLEKAGVSKDQVKAIVEGYGYQTADKVEAMIAELIDGLQDADDVAATFEAMMEAYDLWGALKGDVAKAIAEAIAAAGNGLTDSQMSEVDAAIVAAFKEAFGADVKKTIDGWIGAAFAEYIKDYTTTADLKAMFTDNNAQIAKDIEAANAALKSEILDAIKNGETTSAGLAVRIDALEKAMEAFKAVEARVYELEGRIQSLVWVPATLSEAEYNYVNFNNYYIQLAKGNKTKEVMMMNPEFTMTWQVSPASVASKIKPEHLSIVTEEVAARATVAPEFEIVKAEVKDGKITVVIDTDDNLFNRVNEAAKYPMVALNVAVPASAEGVQGIDFTSNYVAVVPSFLHFNVQPIYYVHDNVNTAFGGVHVHEMEYIDQSKKIFLADSYVGLEDKTNPAKPVFHNIVEYFNSFDAEEGWLELVCYPELDAKKNPVPATITNDAAVGKYVNLSHEGFGIKESNIALIGETVTSGAYEFVIEDAEGYSFSLGTITEQWDITTTIVPVEVAPQSFTWTYKNATTANTYMKEALAIKGLTAEQYNAVKAVMASQPATLYSGKKALGDVTFEFTTTPTADTDVQQLKMTIVTNEFAKGGDYTVVGEYLIDDCLVEITVPVSVKGMPKLADYTIPAKTFTFDGQYKYELLKESYIEKFWAANEAAVKEQITKEDFANFIATSTVTGVAAGNHSSLTRDQGIVYVTFQPAALDKAAAKPAINFEHATGLEVNLATEGVALAKPEIEFVANDYYVVNGRTLLKTEFNGQVFDIEQKDVTLAYSVKGAEGVVLTYSVDDADKAQKAALDKLAGTKPVVNNGVVMWNDWNQLELILRVTATLGGVEVGSHTFVAYINDPVEEAISILLDSKKKPVDLTLYAGESKNTFGVLYLEANEKNIFAATGLDADLEAALNGSVAFETETLNSALSFDKTTGVITVADQGMEIQGDHKVVVKVVYSYKFGNRDFAVEYVVKPGVRQ